MVAERVNCPICSPQLTHLRLLKSYYSPLTEQKYTLFWCLRCDLQFWHPLRMIPDLYVEGRIGGYDPMYLGIRDMPKWCAPFFQFFPLKKGRLLDVGCGDGIFLQEVKARARDLEVRGIDLDQKGIEAARKRNLGNIYPIGLGKFVDWASEKNMKFDIITFFEVLEHQDDPKGFLCKVMRLLKPYGWIAGSVPNRNVPLKDWLWFRDVGDFPPHHFTRWSKYCLKGFLTSMGFEEVFLSHPSIDNWEEVAGWLWSKSFNNVTHGITSAVKQAILNSRGWSNVAVNDIDKVAGLNARSLRTLRRLKRLRNLVLMPLAVIVFKRFVQQGTNIYFQARVVESLGDPR